MAYTDQLDRSRRLTSVAAVALVHLALGYAFISGMAVQFAERVNRTLLTTNVPLPVAPPEVPPPPPSETATARPSKSTAITFTTPIVPPIPAGEAVVVDPMPFVPLPPTTYDPPVAPRATPTPISRAAGARVRGDRGAWFSTDDYPAAAIRAEEQGVAGIEVQVGTTGRVSACNVTATSGSATLDRATCRLYSQRARFEPARDDAGRPVASTYRDTIRWQLPR